MKDIYNKNIEYISELTNNLTKKENKQKWR